MSQKHYFPQFCILVLAGLLACQKDDDVPPVAGRPLVGTWQYLERGYSPGSGYIIDKISLNPAQTVSFTAEHTVSTANVSDGTFTPARTYRIDSTGNDSAKLILLDEKQQELASPMAIRLRNDTLRLVPPCLEGCHFLFVRLP